MVPTDGTTQSEMVGSEQGKPPGAREQFGTEELATVLSNYDLGIIESAQEFPRGSRKSPKMLITAERGKFLLKRRAPGKDNPQRVAFTHAIQLHLWEKKFPLPHLIGTKDKNSSLLQRQGNVYELFEFISAQGYPQTLEATEDAGRVLAVYHHLLLDFKSEWQPGTGSYHQTPIVLRGFEQIRSAGQMPVELVDELNHLYSHSADAAEKQGLANWPKQIAHADWHPGNMLFRDDRVMAVVDYDAARWLPRIMDVANGALQFSIIDGDADVNRWPDFVDESRYRRFIRGYDRVQLLSEAELHALPWLMIEALIAEAAIPIAATGSFGRHSGADFLQMVRRKVRWIADHADNLTEIAER